MANSSLRNFKLISPVSLVQLYNLRQVDESARDLQETSRDLMFNFTRVCSTQAGDVVTLAF